MTETGYFLAADVLGFGRIVRNSNEAALEQRVQRWSDLVEMLADRHEIARFQLISDTLFIGETSTEGGLARLLSFSRELLTASLAKSLPIRGGIVHGRFMWGKLTFGQAVIAAHQLEQSQNWVGVSCAGNLPLIERFWSVDRVVCYPPPLKRAPMQLHPVVAWEVPNSSELLRLLVGGGLTNEGEHVTWELGEKANNTAMFAMYISLLRAQGLDCSNFYGSLPVQAVEAELAKTLR
ncbi:hypothetical protein EAH75_06465 [Rhodanobacter glycinis]|uniref:hypothetical protein n=1 Tax=Rhodanobacter glycinis TaxID=582702 RepID=UPI0011277EAE|nr:hypothetical protein [Rhodanobacter glycinis]TPG51035.1 hypothetical protein EAH75_06465 [Rhodanobacter glycinis]